MIKKDPLQKTLPFLVFLITFSHAFSPSKLEIISENNNFLKPTSTPRVMFLTITGYSSSYDETDEDPWITAYNTLARDGIVASNILPFGTKIKIPSLFGDKIFIVEDRMNPRYGEHIDVWFPTKWQALQFGIHFNVLVEILD
jgi:3D (Asp-Asp-Asp) domain-containing protein